MWSTLQSEYSSILHLCVLKVTQTSSSLKSTICVVFHCFCNPCCLPCLSHAPYATDHLNQPEDFPSIWVTQSMLHVNNTIRRLKLNHTDPVVFPLSGSLLALHKQRTQMTPNLMTVTRIRTVSRIRTRMTTMRMILILTRRMKAE